MTRTLPPGPSFVVGPQDGKVYIAMSPSQEALVDPEAARNIARALLEAADRAETQARPDEPLQGTDLRRIRDGEATS